MKRINFVLPASRDQPIGGYKIIYQYANQLTDNGFDVSISFTYKGYPSVHNVLRQKLGLLKHRIIGGTFPKRITWFHFDSRVKLFFNVISSRDFPNADFLIATSAPTSRIVRELPSSKGKKFYFIQNFETWWYEGDVNQLNQTFNLGLHNIVISQELRSKVVAAGAPEPFYLPNFYDHKEFNLVNSIENRKNKVALLNHVQLTKRTSFGLDVLNRVKQDIPDLEVELFGAYKAPSNLPDYVHFTYKADVKILREKIYGTAKVYLLPSILEGWVLTGMEAMASGALVVSSRIGGIVDYANDKNSILVEPDNKKAFVDAVEKALLDDNLRVGLSREALTDVNKYQISTSTRLLENILQNA
ncbi:glycosyltransferase family 4 protein [Oenococcus oeni]|uniref:glycosyltransferase family 4 protein n=1 Tax=Oenococcus oeni TaxID=1247 RepID=UPI0008F96C0E|nr:glycosyltransferase family 4 protein [Oenococcus oeni]OIM08171.1 polysaccharide biosynthesis protein [Oenococcus oeni]